MSNRRVRRCVTLTRHAPHDTDENPGKSTGSRVAGRVQCRAVSWVEKVLQDTGPAQFRQSAFLDFRSTPGYNFRFLTPGGVAQLGERLNGIQEVRGSIPLASISRESVADSQRGMDSGKHVRR